ncbi:zinc metallopeptidase [Anaerosporobacter faecicola]|uniref:zinc metallopeptidase n=1 Tax=Anaerosporobacter faecicola TaxID=2718714 RepID=UPI00143C57A4|nr:zinc metallopeptidase [Anaerosporobacter faecicola]
MALFYGYGYRYFDPTYLLVLIGVVLSLLASAKVKSTFAKYSNVRSMSGYTGAQAAQRILQNAGIYDVTVQHISGNLTDHYDPRSKVLRLSDSVYGSTSVAAIGVAAHECGHAIQHNKGYAPLKFRTTLVPVANFGATLSWPLIIIGIFLGGAQPLITLGILLFSAAVLFQLVTLPVEFNASNRAVKILAGSGILAENEVEKTRKVLSAAALTYVAAAAASILQLLRLIILFGGRRNRD